MSNLFEARPVAEKKEVFVKIGFTNEFLFLLLKMMSSTGKMEN